MTKRFILGLSVLLLSCFLATAGHAESTATSKIIAPFTFTLFDKKALSMVIEKCTSFGN
jgi:hypothetical protein